MLNVLLCFLLAPQGRNVVLESKFGSPRIVNDGVTVAREVELADPVEDIGAKLVRQAAARTNDTAGDGTTTATILSAAIIAEVCVAPSPVLSSAPNDDETTAVLPFSLSLFLSLSLSLSLPSLPYFCRLSSGMSLTGSFLAFMSRMHRV